MKTFTMTTIALAFLWAKSGCKAADAPEPSLSALGAKAFSGDEISRSEIDTRAIESSIGSLVGTSLEMLRNGKMHQKNVAARLLGVLRERTAISLLIEHITLQETWMAGSYAKGQENVEDFPAYMALKNIGGREVATAVQKARQEKAQGTKERKLLDLLTVELTASE